MKWLVILFVFNSLLDISFGAMSCKDILSFKKTPSILMSDFLQEHSAGLPIRSLMDSEGNLYLFRMIGGEPKFDRNHTRAFLISYSLSPYISKVYAASHPEAHIIVSRQNVEEDPILYRGWSSLDYELPSLRLSGDMFIEKGRHLDEVNLRFETQKPVGYMRLSDFRLKVADYIRANPEPTNHLDFFTAIAKIIIEANSIH